MTWIFGACLMIGLEFTNPGSCQNQSQTVEKLLQATRDRVAEGSLAFADDYSRFAYMTPKGDLFIDGKKVGNFKSATPVIFTHDHQTSAFLATSGSDKVSKLWINGAPQKSEFTPVRVFRAGTRGPIGLLESSEQGTRVRVGEVSSPFITRLSRLHFSQDGSAFTLLYSIQPKPKEGAASTELVGSIDYLIDNNQPAELANRRVGIYRFDEGKQKLEIFGESNPGRGKWNNVDFRFNGVMQSMMSGGVEFDPTDSHFALRTKFTKPTPTGNIDSVHYVIDGVEYSSLDVQTGLSFNDDGRGWTFCGSIGNRWYLQQSGTLPVPIDSHPDYLGCPNEPYRATLSSTNGNLFLFQSRRVRPRIVGPGGFLVEIDADIVVPESLSLSPDGKLLAFVMEKNQARSLVVVELKSPPAGDSLPTSLRVISQKEHQVGLVGREKPIWINSDTLRFLALEKTTIIRVTTKI